MASEAVILALLALPSSLLTAAAVFITAWRTDRKTKTAATELATRADLARIEAGRKLDSNANKLDSNTQKLDQVHTLVNSRMSEALTRIDMLEDMLLQAGIDPNSPARETGSKPELKPAVPAASTVRQKISKKN